MTDNKNSRAEILDGLQCQISKFDNKANILLIVVGLIFAGSMQVFTVFSDLDRILESEKFISLCVFGVAYLLNSMLTIGLLVGAVYPRRKKYNKKDIDVNYYYDIHRYAQLKCKEKLSEKIDDYNHEDKDVMVSQIIINSSIAVKKHQFITTSCFSMIPQFLFFTVLVSIGYFW